MVLREGYHGLNMDRIAEAVEYSKGTIYNHFSCKEEIIIALAIQTVGKRVDLFRKAAEFKGRSRFRMVAIGEAAETFVRDFPDYFMFEEIIQLPSVREKTSEKRQAVIRGCEMQCMSVVAGVVRDAVAQEDLQMPRFLSPEQLVFGLWALTSGAYSIMLRSQSLEQLGLDDPFAAVRIHTSALLDGHGWKPHSSEFDLEKLLVRIRREVFDHD
jgi:AcrR family transcriptional regulator